MTAAVAVPGLEVLEADGAQVLLAVDGNSLAHRAFHGYGATGMRTPQGRPAWAVFGFMTLLTRIIDRVGPDAVVVGFDDRQASARRDRFVEYKAGRPERSDDLYTQMDDIAAVLAELGVTVVTPPALEADDVLASAAAAAERAGWRCVIATSDKDAFGLISGSTTVLRLVTGLDNAVEMTPQALLEQYGVSPGQWADYTALVGDKSDALPGVTGFGPKTAVKLLTACRTLDMALGDPAAVLAAVGKAGAGKLAAVGARAVIDRNRDIMAPVRDIPLELGQCRPVVAAATVARVLKAWHLPSLIDRSITALCRPATTAAEPPGADAGDSRPASAPGVVVCRSQECGAQIRLVTMSTGKTMPVDAQPDPAGTLGWAKTEQGWRMHVLAGGEIPEDGRRWVSHFVTCAQPADHRKPRPVAGVSSRATAVLEQAGLRPETVPRSRPALRPVRDEPAVLVYPFWCQTPGHEQQPARLYAGGVFCDPCAQSRAGNIAVHASIPAGRDV